VSFSEDSPTGHDDEMAQPGMMMWRLWLSCEYFSSGEDSPTGLKRFGVDPSGGKYLFISASA